MQALQRLLLAQNRRVAPPRPREALQLTAQSWLPGARLLKIGFGRILQAERVESALVVWSGG